MPTWYYPDGSRWFSAFPSRVLIDLEMSKAIRELVLSTDIPSPGMLFACQRSREVALKQFSACLELKSGKKTAMTRKMTLFSSQTLQRFPFHHCFYHSQNAPTTLAIIAKSFVGLKHLRCAIMILVQQPIRRGNGFSLVSIIKDPDYSTRSESWSRNASLTSSFPAGRRRKMGSHNGLPKIGFPFGTLSETS